MDRPLFGNVLALGFILERVLGGFLSWAEFHGPAGFQPLRDYLKNSKSIPPPAHLEVLDLDLAAPGHLFTLDKLEGWLRGTEPRKKTSGFLGEIRAIRDLETKLSGLRQEFRNPVFHGREPRRDVAQVIKDMAIVFGHIRSWIEVSEGQPLLDMEPETFAGLAQLEFHESDLLEIVQRGRSEPIVVELYGQEFQFYRRGGLATEAWICAEPVDWDLIGPLRSKTTAIWIARRPGNVPDQIEPEVQPVGMERDPFGSPLWRSVPRRDRRRVGLRRAGG